MTNRSKPMTPYLQMDGFCVPGNDGIPTDSPLLNAIVPAKNGNSGQMVPETDVLVYLSNSLACMRTDGGDGVIDAIIEKVVQAVSNKDVFKIMIDPWNGVNTVNSQLYALNRLQEYVRKLLDKLVQNNCLNDGFWVNEDTFEELKGLLSGNERVLNNLTTLDTGERHKAFRISKKIYGPMDTNPLGSLANRATVENFLTGVLPPKHTKPEYSYTNGLQKPWAYMPRPDKDTRLQAYHKPEGYFEDQREKVLKYVNDIVDRLAKLVHDLTLMEKTLKQSIPESIFD